jgi:hypothetical protein
MELSWLDNVSGAGNERLAANICLTYSCQIILLTELVFHMSRPGVQTNQEVRNPMKSPGKCFTFAIVALGLSIFAMPTASACPAHTEHVMTQPAVIDSTVSMPAVLDTTVTQPAIIDRTIVEPAVVDTTVLTQPAVVDTCPTTVLTQPAVVGACDPCAGTTVLTQPAVIERDRHLLELNTPLLDINLF